MCEYACRYPTVHIIRRITGICVNVTVFGVDNAIIIIIIIIIITRISIAP